MYVGSLCVPKYTASVNFKKCIESARDEFTKLFQYHFISLVYPICFAGAARTGVQCELCLSLSDPTRDCALVTDKDPDVASKLKTFESAILDFTSFPQPAGGAPRQRLQEVCLQELECRPLPNATVAIHTRLRGSVSVSIRGSRLSLHILEHAF